MKQALAVVVLMASVALATDKKAFLGQAGNDNLELTGAVMIEAADIRQELGSELGPGYVVVRVKATNKTDAAMHVGPDDFTLISRKDGDRADALAPGQLAGGSALIVKRDRSGRDWAHQTDTPGFTGVSGIGKADKPMDETLLATLKTKEMADAETKPNGSLEGLLYFSMENPKMKSKDLALLYKGPGGRLTVEFK